MQTERIQNPEKKTRVLLIITRLTTGGDTNVVLDIASHLNNHPRFAADLAAGPVPPEEVDLTFLARERNIPTRIVPCLINHIDPMLNMRAILQLRKLMIKGQYEIVHTHSSVAGVIGRIAALSAGVPAIVHHVHGWGIQEGMSAGMRTLYLGLERLCASFTKRLIVVSRPTRQKGLAYRIGREDQYALIYNGIQLEKFRQKYDERQVRLELGLDPDCRVVGMIGRLDRQKNPLDFIRAAAIVRKRYQKVQFLIAGEGVLRNECRSLIQDLNLDGNFFLLGFRNDVEKIMAVLDLIVSSSLWEGLPVVFQEAMSAGKPIVANDVDGASDVIIDGETGYRVAPHKPAEMAERILNLLGSDDLCKRMGLAAQRNAESFSSEQMLDRLVSLYQDVTPRDGCARP